jgi:hypothetical protein
MLVAGGIAGLIVAFPSPPPPKEEQFSNAPADIIKIPKPHAFAPRKNVVMDVAEKFVMTAVARKHVEDSWELAAPSLREGYTKRSWSKGEIPVVPYPVYSARWRLGYSVTDEVNVKVALFPPPRSKMAAAVFDLVLERFRPHGHTRWLVSQFTPTPSRSMDYPSSKPVTRTSTAAPPGSNSTHLSRLWLLFPASIFGILLMVLAGLGIRSWRTAAVYKAYVRERQSSS